VAAVARAQLRRSDYEAEICVVFRVSVWAAECVVLGGEAVGEGEGAEECGVG
jgi:hypothetical protein